MQAGDARQGGGQGLGVGEVALHHLDAIGEVGLRRIAGQGTDGLSTAEKLRDHLAAYGSGCSGHEIRHGKNV
ncbi:hypothetical protein GCM10010381_45140 [Streptomyces xantholiticus]|nr:hypothetical protein GCM10010381_45140 [Streptomyces xantholiticus]